MHKSDLCGTWTLVKMNMNLSKTNLNIVASPKKFTQNFTSFASIILKMVFEIDCGHKMTLYFALQKETCSRN
jgi:hypothetical protein